MHNTPMPYSVRFVRAVYSFLLIGASRVWFAVAGVRHGFHGARWQALLARFGRGPLLDGLPQQSLWLHAVSGGEVAATALLYPALRKALGDRIPIILTCATSSGMAMAEKRFPQDVHRLYAPLDTPGVVRRFFDKLNPAILAVAEIEIWPNLFREAAKREIPLVLYNARMPDADLGRYTRFRWIFRHILSAVRVIAAQTAEDAARYCAIGAPADRIMVTGNIKNDQEYRNPPVCAFQFDQADPRPVILLASSHPGEERAVLDAVKGLGVRLVVAPRHITRARKIAALLRSSGHTFTIRSKMEGEEAVITTDVLLLDTFGELMLAAKESLFVIMGGSFTRRIQGHNPMEAAALSRPVILGPCMDNFRDVRDALLAGGGAVSVSGYSAVRDAVQAWVDNPSDAERSGKQAHIVLESLRGASARTAEIMATQLVGRKKFDSFHLSS
ncbi:MAG TPA: glycosyltransferase N-terminal domain-containing protein [Spirochaetota bacterium]|nr:glycosyltransferase N-terminal domain-containing protein [Spirochaetota bacterium]